MTKNPPKTPPLWGALSSTQTVQPAVVPDLPAKKKQVRGASGFQTRIVKTARMRNKIKKKGGMQAATVPQLDQSLF